MSRSANWTPIIDRFFKRLSNWKAKALSFGGRLTLIKSVLGSLGVYYFSTFKAPKMVTNKLKSIRRKFFWGGSWDSNKIAWNAWKKVLAPRDQGGLNVGSLRVSNLSLLAKWWWRFLIESSFLWCKVIRLIHGPQGGLHDVSSIKSKAGPWFQIAKLDGDFSEYGIDLHSLFKVKVGNGESTYSDFSSVGSAAMGYFSPPGIWFHWAWNRALWVSDLQELMELQSLMSNYHLFSPKQDRWECVIDNTRSFTVGGMKSLITFSPSSLSTYPYTWNKLVPIKVNISSWRIKNNRIPTRVNLDNRGIDLHST
ncbi:hypothetical protein Tco_0452279 [Tanacetum coccineum]